MRLRICHITCKCCTIFSKAKLRAKYLETYTFSVTACLKFIVCNIQYIHDLFIVISEVNK